MRDSLNNRIPKTAMVIRATEVSEFRNCRRKWFYSSHNGLNLEPKMRDKKLSEGICWHAGLESYYRTGDFKPGFDQSFAKEVQVMQRVIGDGIFDPDIQADLEEREQRAYALFEEYRKWADNEAYPPDTAMDIVGVEVRLLVPFRNPAGNRTRAWVATRLDGVVKVDGVYYILEHKYQSKSSQVDNPQNLPLDLQMGIQIWALQQYLAHHHKSNPIVGGALYNLTRKQMPSPRVKAPLFGRHIVRRSAKELDILLATLYKDSIDMRRTKRDPTERTYNPQPTGVCTWGCAFRSVCESMNRGEDTKLLLDTGFRPRNRDIWQMLNEEMKGE